MMYSLAESLEGTLEGIFRCALWSTQFNLLFCVALLAGALTCRGIFGLFKVKVGFVRCTLGFLLIVLSLLAASAWVDVLAVPRIDNAELAQWLPIGAMLLGGLLAIWLFGRLLWRRGLFYSLSTFCLSLFVASCAALVVDSVYSMVLYVQREMEHREDDADLHLKELNTVVLPDSPEAPDSQ